MMRRILLCLGLLAACGLALPWPRDLAPVGAIRGAAAGTIRIAPPTADLELGLVARWRFNEGGGGFAYDSGSTGGNTATLVGAPAWVAGRGGSGGALALNGTTQFARFPGYGVPYGANPRTLCAWFRLNQTTAAYALLQYGDNSAYERFDIYVDPSTATVGVEVGTVAVATAAWTPDTTSWHLLCASHPAGQTSSNAIKLYFDGTRRTETRTNAGTLATDYGSADTQWAAIGGIPINGTNYNGLPGAVDEALIWERELSAWEHAALYGRGPQ